MATYCYRCCKRIVVEETLDQNSAKSENEEAFEKVDASAFDLQEEKVMDFFRPDFSQYLQVPSVSQKLTSQARPLNPAFEPIETNQELEPSESHSPNNCLEKEEEPQVHMSKNEA